VEFYLTGRSLHEGSGWKKALITLVPTLLDELGKLLFAALAAIPFLILFLIPGINLVAPALWFLYTAWILTLEYSDYPMGNYGLRFREIRTLLRQKIRTGTRLLRHHGRTDHGPGCEFHRDAERRRRRNGHVGGRAEWIGLGASQSGQSAAFIAPYRSLCNRPSELNQPGNQVD